MLEPNSVLWLSHHGPVPRTVSPCTSAMGMHVLSGSQSSSRSQSCWNYYFSKVFARGNWLWKNSLWFWLYFCRVINLGKRCFTCSRLLRSCANSAPSWETNKKDFHIDSLLSPIHKVPRCLANCIYMCTEETSSHHSKDGDYSPASWTVKLLFWTGREENC